MPNTRSIAYYNGEFGFLEAFVRAQRDRMFSASDYISFTQCTSLNDLLMNLNSSAYGDSTRLMANFSSQALSDILTKRLADDMKEIKGHAQDPLSTFIDFLFLPYTIDNVILIILQINNAIERSGGSGAAGGMRGLPGVDVGGGNNAGDNQLSSGMTELQSKLHPLGMFPTIGTLLSCETTADLLDALVDTPLGRYVCRCEILNGALVAGGEGDSTGDNPIAEVDIEVLRSSLYRLYLQDFYDFVLKIGGETSEALSPVLAFEADRLCINVTLNSLDTELNRDQRLSLFPDFGLLYPVTQQNLAQCTDYDSVSSTVEQFEELKVVFEGVALSPGKALSDSFYEQEVKQCKKLMIDSFSFGVFYAFVKLREQEIRNIVWIAECISQGSRNMINNYIPIW